MEKLITYQEERIAALERLSKENSDTVKKLEEKARILEEKVQDRMARTKSLDLDEPRTPLLTEVWKVGDFVTAKDRTSDKHGEKFVITKVNLNANPALLELPIRAKWVSDTQLPSGTTLYIEMRPEDIMHWEEYEADAAMQPDPCHTPLLTEVWKVGDFVTLRKDQCGKGVKYEIIKVDFRADPNWLPITIRRVSLLEKMRETREQKPEELMSWDEYEAETLGLFVASCLDSDCGTDSDTESAKSPPSQSPKTPKHVRIVEPPSVKSKRQAHWERSEKEKRQKVVTMDMPKCCTCGETETEPFTRLTIAKTDEGHTLYYCKARSNCQPCEYRCLLHKSGCPFPRRQIETNGVKVTEMCSYYYLTDAQAEVAFNAFHKEGTEDGVRRWAGNCVKCARQ